MIFCPQFVWWKQRSSNTSDFVFMEATLGQMTISFWIIWASLIAQLVKNPPASQETEVGKIPWRRDRLPTPVFLGFPCGSASKEFACNVGDLGSIPGLGRFPGEGKVYPLQYPGLENSMDCIVHGVAKNQTRLSDFHFTSHIQKLLPLQEKGLKEKWSKYYLCSILNQLWL